MDQVARIGIVRRRQDKKRVAWWWDWLDRLPLLRSVKDLDDRALRDINLTRDQVHTEIPRPYWMP